MDEGQQKHKINHMMRVHVCHCVSGLKCVALASLPFLPDLSPSVFVSVWLCVIDFLCSDLSTPLWTHVTHVVLHVRKAPILLPSWAICTVDTSVSWHLWHMCMSVSQHREDSSEPGA